MAKKASPRGKKRPSRGTLRKSRTFVDGGHEAITGFVIQSMGALLDALHANDWAVMAVDPYHEDGSSQKIDIEWTMLDGKSRVIQVKHSKNRIGLPDAKRWATELRRSRKADEYVLVLFAPSAGRVSTVKQFQGVRIVSHEGNPETLWNALAYRLILYLRTLVSFDAAYARTVVKDMVGATITGVTEQTRWTPATLRENLLRFVRGCATPEYATDMGLSVSFLRVLRGFENGGGEEFLRYTFHNRSSRAIPIPIWRVNFTDVQHINVHRVCEVGYGSPRYRVLKNEQAGVFQLEITPTTIVHPDGTGVIECLLERLHVFDRIKTNDEDLWQFQDPLLATPSPQQATVCLIFPVAGRITAQNAQVCARTVTWDVWTGSEMRRLNATLRAGVLPLPETNERLLAELTRFFSTSKPSSVAM